jgi:hypothetical protein
MSNAHAAVYSMESNPDSVVSVTQLLLFSDPAVEATRPSYDDGEKWFENLTKTILNWIHQGKVRFLSVVREGFRKLIGDKQEHLELLEKFTPTERVLLRTAVIEEMLAYCESSFNHSRFHEVLVGKKRAAWRRALIKLFVEDRPMPAGDFVASKIFNMPGAAHSALEELTKRGLLMREGPSPGKKGKVYSLTTEGRGVASMAQVIESTEAADRDESSFSVMHTTPAEQKEMREYMERVLGISLADPGDKLRETAHPASRAWPFGTPLTLDPAIETIYAEAGMERLDPLKGYESVFGARSLSYPAAMGAIGASIPPPAVLQPHTEPSPYGG